MSKSEEKKVQGEERTAKERVDEPSGEGGPFSFWEILEERIVQLVRRIASLQEENAELRKRLVEREEELKKAKSECERLSALKREMREKVERLIVKIEEYQEMADKEELPKPSKE